MSIGFARCPSWRVRGRGAVSERVTKRGIQCAQWALGSRVCPASVEREPMHRLHSKFRSWVRFAFAATIGCASTGTRPSDMSARQHEQAANQDQRSAQAHQEQYDPNAWSGGGGGCDTLCFATWSNPTSEHAQQARKHRSLAAKHRRASERLREAERRLCAGIPERDRDVSPFFHFADIASVTTESEPFEVRFNPIGGLDAGAMQRLVDCHIGRNAVLGLAASKMDFCPLVARGVRAKVRADGNTIVVELEAEDPDGRDEVRARLLRLQALLD